MNIAMIGTGRMARGLGTGWSKAGHRVVYGSRRPQQREGWAESLDQAQVVDQAAALAGAEVVVIAIPFTAVAAFAQAHAGQLQGKIVVDITNPFDHLPDNRISAAEMTAQAIAEGAGDGARVVAAFKDNFARTLGEPIDPGGLRRDVHYAGDDAEAKAVVAQLARDLGFEPVDCGALKACRILDVMVPLMIDIDRRLAGGQGQSSWKFVVGDQ
jgi:8-hydroxy-5-deazaflavin:NADPH oxidoreductase